MAQDGTTAGGSSYTIDNVTFPVGRTKLQSIFNAIRSSNIGNTAPDLVAGQFWIDNNTPSTTVWTLYLYDGTDNISFATIDTVNNTVNFIDSTFDLINDTTPQLGGNLASNGHDILFADNDKAIFGTGNDLEIYHDGSNSYINEVGTGDLFIRSDADVAIQNAGGTASKAVFRTNGASFLYYAGSKKFETTSAGAAVTGTLTTGAITSTGNFTFNVADGMNINTKESLNINIDTDDNDSSRVFAVTSGSGGTSETLILASEDAGVNLYYDNSKKFETTNTGATITGNLTASGNLTSLGIDDNADSSVITLTNAEDMLVGTGADRTSNLSQSSGNVQIENGIVFESGSSSTNNEILTYRSNSLVFGTGASERMRLNSTGLGIGTSSIDGKLHLDDGTSTKLIIEKDGGGFASLTFHNDGTSTSYIQLDASEDMVHYGGSGVNQIFYASASERMRLTSNGLGIGTSAPSAEIHISKSANGGNTEIILENSFNASGSTDETTQLQSRFGGYDASYIITGKEEDFTTSANRSSFMSFTTRKDGTLSEKLRISSAGSVGIGLTNPDSFHVSGRDLVVGNTTGGHGLTIVASTNDAGSINFGDATNASTRGKVTYEHSNDSLAFHAGGAEKFRVGANGNFSIGTTADSARLNVNTSNSGVAPNSFADDLFVESSGHTGITIGSGSSHLSSIYFANSSDNDIGRIEVDHAAGHMRFHNNASERARFDALGRLNIGTTSSISGSLLNINGGFINADVTDSSHKFIRSTTATTGLGDPMICRVNTSADMADGFASVITFQVSDSGVSNSSLGFIGATRSGADNSGSLIFHTYNSGSQAEKLRIHPNGRQTFNHNSTASAHANFVGEVGSSYRALAFEHSNGGGIVGSVTTGSSSVAYNTSSDYRLKENVVEITDATTRLKQLKPKRFNFIADANTTVDGFIAHEVSSVVPEAITGTKDAVDADGNPEYQGIDQAKLVPLLVKTIQELEARITTLEANNP